MIEPIESFHDGHDLVEIFDCEQNSPEWIELRLGLPTASNFKTIARDGDAKTRMTLLYRLAGEILTQQPAENFRSLEMDRGLRMEASARSDYELTRGVEVRRVGFIRRTVESLGSPFVVGCSPDGLPSNGLLEIKTLKPELLIPLIEKGRFPLEHRHQCQGSLWVSGRPWADLVITYEGFPVSPTFPIERDEAFIRELSDSVETFSHELSKIVAGMRKRSRR